MPIHQDIGSIPIVGGWLALDFANTTSERHTGAPCERLTSYDDLLVWAGRVGLLDDAAALALREAARADPGAAERALQQALELREIIYEVFAALAVGETPAEVELARLTQARRTAAAHHRLAASGDGYAWSWDGNEADLSALVHPLAESAAQLLLSGEVHRVHECAGPDCDWLFLDTSRNQTRRWCDMRECGNRAKARRHYARHRAGAGREEEA